MSPSTAPGPAPPHDWIAFPDAGADPVVVSIGALGRHPDDPRAAHAVAASVFGLPTTVDRHVADLVLGSEGAAARMGRDGRDDARSGRIITELQLLGAIAHADLPALLRPHGLADAVPEAREAWEHHRPVAATWMREELVDRPDWGTLAPRLAAFWREEGSGPLAIARVLRFGADGLVPVARPDVVRPEDLIGGATRRAPLGRALGAFVAGGPAVDALLYGPPGTGKSTVARALANAHAADGLRLIQVERTGLGRLGTLFAALAGDGPRCLVLLDDLVFDEHDRLDRELRAALEGDVAARPANVAVWATSNRFRLLHETRSEREEDVEGELGRGERAALATRFGLRVAFPALSVDEFVEVATGLVRRAIGEVPEGFAARARRTAVDRGLTPRAARQLADLVAGKG